MTFGQMAFFVLMFLSVAFPVAIIFYARLVRPLGLCRRYRVALGTVVFLLVLLAGASTPIASLIARDAELAQTLHFDVWGGWPYYLMTFIWVLVTCLLLRGALVYGSRFCMAIVRWRRERKRRQSRASTKADVEADCGESDGKPARELALGCGGREDVDEGRRLFLERAKQAATLGAVFVCLPPVVHHARGERVIRRVVVDFDDLPEALVGLKIAHLSDIHVGNTMYRENIADIVRETNALDPDIIVITGDLADGYPEVIGSWLDPMRDLRSRFGTYFVTGNHDHMWNARGWVKVVEALGIVHLDNEHRIIDVGGTPLAIAGAIDARGERRGRWKSDPEKALSGIDSKTFKLMLVHQPASVDRSLAAGADLVLVGHTHGGQFWPISYLIDALHHYARGLYRVGPEGRQAVYVSCGTGYWGPPIRVGVPPEIIDIRLARRTPSNA